MLEKKQFVNYGKGTKAPIAIKLNEHDSLMLSIGQYIFNMDSKSGVLKKLSHIGLKVILKDFGAEEMHYLTNGERRRYIRDKPNIEAYLQKGNDNKG